MGLGLAVEDRVGDADPAPVRAQLRVFEPRQELRDGPFDGDLVVALHVRRRAILAGLPLDEARVERVERGGHEERHVLEAEPLPHGARARVREQHMERDRGGARGPGVLDAGAHERPRHPAAPRTWPHVHEMEMHRAVLEQAELRETDRPLGVLGEKHAARLELTMRVAPLLLPALGLEPGWLRDLGLELLPELAQHRLVGGGRAADRYGFVSHPTRR